MWFWYYLLFLSLLIPSVMAIIGLCFKRKAPREINMVLGYRTRRSMLTQHTWLFAHKYCGRIWLWGGLALLPVVLICMLLVREKSVDTVGFVGAGLLLLPILFMIVSVFLTERALKKNFTPFGYPLHTHNEDDPTA